MSHASELSVSTATSRREGWLADIDYVFARDPAARSRIEIIMTYPGVHAILLHRVAHRLWRLRLRLAARLVSFLSRMCTQIDIHPGAQIGRRFFIDHGCGVVIGETAIIGDDVTLYHGVTLGGTSWSPGKRHPTLSDRVVVGAGAKILGPVTIHADARVGANSVVVKDVPVGMTVVGVPGRLIQGPRAEPAGQRLTLNHHELPDPIERSMAGVLARLRSLEQRLSELTEQAGDPISGESRVDAPLPRPWVVDAIRPSSPQLTVVTAGKERNHEVD